MKDALFTRVVYLLVTLVAIYGVGVGVVLLVTDAEDDVIVRYIASFGSVFAGLLGLCSGYLIGQRNGNANGNHK